MSTENPIRNNVNFATPRSYGTTLKSHLKETFFPDDPFRQFRNDKSGGRVIKKAVQYFIPIFEWLPNYNLRLFRFDVLAGITITSLAIPQGISYAKLANLPPIIGLYSSFVPPLIYAVFGNSKHLAVGTVAACSLLIGNTIGEKTGDSGGLLVTFNYHRFMGGTATLICLQQLKGIFGLKHFTTKTDAVSVLRAILQNRKEWKWQSTIVGIIFLVFLQFTRFLRRKRPNLFWVSAIGPMAVVVVGCLFAYFADADKHGIQIVGHLNRGLNPLSIKRLNFDSQYIPVTLKAGLITALIALAEGIAIGRSFAIMTNEQVDGNKEIMAFGLMNIVGSFTSCYLTTGPFSKTAVNYNAGFALSAIIMSAMLGLINYGEIYHLFKVDKFDFVICISCFLGVAFISMNYGLMISIGLALARTLLYAARPATCRLGQIPNSYLYRDTEQYPGLTRVPGVLALQLGSPIYFANSNYIRERILRWIREEEDISNAKESVVEHILLDLSGVTSIDTTGIETLIEIRKMLEAKSIKARSNGENDKVTLCRQIGKESIFLSIEDAVEASLFSMSEQKQQQQQDDFV
ncbi:hypothetical protein GH714_033331 [Hevea brasiliensis]|uniref:STAS domain-containing protein n=1 Tax=Hevea brasiliensis TaxID=3981 RepID=A0A6A6LVN8_HEVBR|nr:hypothetical protein GH714_033331 [Hevea brasiliensis]